MANVLDFATNKLEVLLNALPKNEKSFAIKMAIQKVDLKNRGLKNKNMNRTTITPATNFSFGNRLAQPLRLNISAKLKVYTSIKLSC